MSKLVRILFICISLGAISVYKFGTARHHDTPKSIKPDQISIVFDLGGVLIDTNTFNALWSLGPLLILNDWLTNKSDKSIRERFFHYLSKVDENISNAYGAKDDHGFALPGLFCEYMAGNITSKEALNGILPAFRDNIQWFANHSEQLLMIRMAKMIFNPKRFTKTREFLSEGIRLVKDLKKHGLKVYILSNWDPESFEIMKKINPQFFSYFDDIFISGDLHALKPHRDAFKPFLEQLKPGQTIFIDDQQENIAAAQDLGINAVLCQRPNNKPNFKKLKQKILHIYYEIIDHSESVDTPAQELSPAPQA